MIDKKKAQGMIVTAVILILIVVALSVIVMNFAVPFVKEQLAGTDCLEVVNQVSFSNNPTYTCFEDQDNADPLDDEMFLQVHIGDKNESLDGFQIEIGGASTRNILIELGNTDTDGVKMFGLTDTDPLVIPGKNEDRTYVISTNGKPEIVNIYPVLNDGRSCDISDKISKVNAC